MPGSVNRVTTGSHPQDLTGQLQEAGNIIKCFLTQVYEEVRRPIQGGKVGLPWKEEKVLPSEWRQHTHPGELMIRKALGFGSTVQREVMRNRFWGHSSHASISPFGKGPSDPTGSQECLQRPLWEEPSKATKAPGPSVKAVKNKESSLIQ